MVHIRRDPPVFGHPDQLVSSREVLQKAAFRVVRKARPPSVLLAHVAALIASGRVENATSHSMYVQRPEDTSSRFRSKEETVMRVLVLAKEGEANGAATPPSPEAVAEYQKFNDELVKAGVVLESGRLSPSSQGKRVRFDGKNRTVIDGPFAESKELVGGYWLWQVRSIDEALEWLRRAPYDGGTFEIREVSQHEGA